MRLSLAWYSAALLRNAAAGAGRLDRGHRARAAARWCWTWGIVCFLVHLAMAFHYYHHWSHAHAFERTRQVSGTGEGIYISYLFTWLWIGDAAWWWISPRRYAARSVWIDRVLHAFMLVIVFNGMVIFEEGPIRLAGIALVIVLARRGCRESVARGLRATRRDAEMIKKDAERDRERLEFLERRKKRSRIEVGSVSSERIASCCRLSRNVWRRGSFERSVICAAHCVSAG